MADESHDQTPPGATQQGPPSRPPAQTPPPTAWIVPPDAGPPGLPIGSIVGRAFDTFGREWSLYIALAIPVGVVALVEALIPLPTLSQNPTFDELAALIPIEILTSLVSFLAGAIVSTAVIVATDAQWQGRPIGFVEAYRLGLRALPRLIGAEILVGLGLLGLLLVGGLAGLVLLQLGPLGAVLIAVLALVWIGIFVVVGVRLTLLAMVAVLETHGVPGTIRRTWTQSRGRALSLFGLGIGLILASILPLWGASLFSSFAHDAWAGGLALALASLLFTPLTTIGYTLAWGWLVGNRYRDTEVMAERKGRRTATLIVVGLGLILLVAGCGVAAGSASTFATPEITAPAG